MISLYGSHMVIGYQNASEIFHTRILQVQLYCSTIKPVVPIVKFMEMYVIFTYSVYNWTTLQAALCISVIDNDMILRVKPFNVRFTLLYFTEIRRLLSLSIAKMYIPLRSRNVLEILDTLNNQPIFP